MSSIKTNNWAVISAGVVLVLGGVAGVGCKKDLTKASFDAAADGASRDGQGRTDGNGSGADLLLIGETGADSADDGGNDTDRVGDWDASSQFDASSPPDAQSQSDASTACTNGQMLACSCGAAAGGMKICAAGQWGGCTIACSANGLLGKCASGVQTCDDAHGMWSVCSIAPAAADSCAPGNDDNCNGIKNERCGCLAGEMRTCDKGGMFGKCATGTQTCGNGNWGACSIAPAAADSCAAGNDDSCNGIVNEGCSCVQGATRPCKDGGLFGKCATGTQTCQVGSKWSACTITPSAEDTCVPGNDDTCDGTANAGCTCIEGQTRTCAQAGLLGKCATGTETCAAGGKWGNCSIAPSAADTCAQGNDDNCNGRANENCVCIVGGSRSCSDAGAKGSCAAGTQGCGTNGQWGACSITPASADTCEPNNDDTCNGKVNEGCICTHGQVRTCAAAGIQGTCAGGSQSCGTNGQWGACSIAPKSADACTPGNDDSCNGVVNEGCACTQGETRTCAAGGLKGPCASGSESCGTNGQWGACSIAPKVADTCIAGNDDTCNGVANEGCACTQGQTRTCAAAGLSGACAAGSETCGTNGQWGACSIAPKSGDSCVAGNDDNCNGRANEGCACINGQVGTCGECGNSRTCTNGQWPACASCCPTAVADNWRNIALSYDSTPWRITWPPSTSSAAKPVVDPASAPVSLFLPRDSIVDRNPIYPRGYVISFNVLMAGDTFGFQTGMSGILEVFPAIRRAANAPLTIGGLKYGQNSTWTSFGDWTGQSTGGPTALRMTVYVKAGASQVAALADTTGFLVASGFQSLTASIGPASYFQLMGSNLHEYDGSTRTVKIGDVTGCADLGDGQVQALYDLRKEY